MLTEELMENYSMVGDLISMMSSGVMLFLILKVLYFKRNRQFMFLEMALHGIFVASAMNISFAHSIKAGLDVGFFIGFRYIYHETLIFTLYCFIRYMKEMMDVDGKLVRAVTYFTRIFMGTSALLVVLAPITHFGFYYENGLWYDPTVNPYTIFYVYSVSLFFVMLVFFAERMIRPVRICLAVTDVLVMGIMVYQAIVNINTFTTFTYLLPVLVVMVMLHSTPFDDKTGALSAASFNNFVTMSVEKQLSVDYMVLKLKINVLDHMPDELGKVLNSFWHGTFRHAYLFSLDNDLYVLAVPRDKRNYDTENRIRKIVETDFDRHYSKYRIPYKVVGLFDIDFVENEADIIGILRYVLMGMEENSINMIDDDRREALKLFMKVKENLAEIDLQGNLDDDRVLVYCQPIKNTGTGRYDTAEALMRMTISDNIFLRPDQFIPVAEEYGHIHTLSKIILNKVCKEIRRLEAEGYYFNRISVNFVASEIIEENFCDEILSIIRSNGVEPSKIGIELTESQSEGDFKIVKDRIATLRDAGMTVYLDDVGTGYSNIDRIVKYDVDVVKFDRFFILEAEKDPRKASMMEHLSHAFRELDYDLLYEGIETEDNEKMCRDCGADYLQGFMYSKPVPIEKMREFFSKE